MHSTHGLLQTSLSRASGQPHSSARSSLAPSCKGVSFHPSIYLWDTRIIAVWKWGPTVWHSITIQSSAGSKRSIVETGVTARLASLLALGISHWARWPPTTSSCPEVASVHGLVLGSQETSTYLNTMKPHLSGCPRASTELGPWQTLRSMFYGLRKRTKRGRKEVREEGRLSGWNVHFNHPKVSEATPRAHSLVLAVTWGRTVAPYWGRALCVRSLLGTSVSTPHRGANMAVTSTGTCLSLSQILWQRDEISPHCIEAFP